MKYLRLSAAFAFLFAGMVGLIGCIWLPGSYDRTDGKVRPERQIGAVNSGKPLELNRATRAAVERLLGRPDAQSRDNRKLIYTYQVHTETWLCAIFPTYEASAPRFLRLEFDAENRLIAYKVFKHEHEANAGFFEGTVPWPGRSFLEPQ